MPASTETLEARPWWHSMQRASGPRPVISTPEGKTTVSHGHGRLVVAGDAIDHRVDRRDRFSTTPASLPSAPKSPGSRRRCGTWRSRRAHLRDRPRPSGGRLQPRHRRGLTGPHLPQRGSPSALSLGHSGHGSGTRRDTRPRGTRPRGTSRARPGSPGTRPRGSPGSPDSRPLGSPGMVRGRAAANQDQAQQQQPHNQYSSIFHFIVSSPPIIFICIFCNDHRAVNDHSVNVGQHPLSLHLSLLVPDIHIQTKTT